MKKFVATIEIPVGITVRTAMGIEEATKMVDELFSRVYDIAEAAVDEAKVVEELPDTVWFSARYDDTEIEEAT